MPSQSAQEAPGEATASGGPARRPRPEALQAAQGQACEECGELFVPGRYRRGGHRQRFCSPRCRQKAGWRRADKIKQAKRHAEPEVELIAEQKATVGLQAGARVGKSAAGRGVLSRNPATISPRWPRPGSTRSCPTRSHGRCSCRSRPTPSAWPATRWLPPGSPGNGRSTLEPPPIPARAEGAEAQEALEVPRPDRRHVRAARCRSSGETGERRSSGADALRTAPRAAQGRSRSRRRRCRDGQGPIAGRTCPERARRYPVRPVAEGPGPPDPPRGNRVNPTNLPARFPWPLRVLAMGTGRVGVAAIGAVQPVHHQLQGR
jgi:hypothetical protein